MENLFEITDYYELLALHRALHEAKFCKESSDFDMKGSRFVADLSNRVADGLISYYSQNGNATEVERWASWRRKTIRKGDWRWDIAMNDVVRDRELWQQMDENDKIEYTKILFSPYILTKDLIEEFMETINSAVE